MEEIRIKDVISWLETLAPLSYQESFDNAGLIIGDHSALVKGVLISLDATEEVIEEAIATGCNLVVVHHPIVFKGLKKLTGSNYVERTVSKAIKGDVAIYAIHTNLDNVLQGVNAEIAAMIGLKDVKILSPKTQLLTKLVSFSPKGATQKVLDALHSAGAGSLGNYSHCSFTTTGTGTFEPNEYAKPYIGSHQQLEKVEEDRLEVIFPSHLQPAVLSALKSAHPYEEVAYFITQLLNENQEIGSGMIGSLPQPLSQEDFLKQIKLAFGTETIKYTPVRKMISKVAVCGGAGSFLLNKAKQAHADAFVTSDFKYHEFFDAEGQILIADIGHYESEVCTKKLLFSKLIQKFTNIALRLSKANTNPVRYYL